MLTQGVGCYISTQLKLIKVVRGKESLSATLHHLGADIKLNTLDARRAAPISLATPKQCPEKNRKTYHTLKAKAIQDCRLTRRVLITLGRDNRSLPKTLTVPTDQHVSFVPLGGLTTPHN